MKTNNINAQYTVPTRDCGRVGGYFSSPSMLAQESGLLLWMHQHIGQCLHAPFRQNCVCHISTCAIDVTLLDINCLALRVKHHQVQPVQ